VKEDKAQVELVRLGSSLIPAMLQNYLTTFLRIVLRQKIYSAINIFGLAIGIASVLLIALYIDDELSYDQFHKDADRIYRMGWLTRFSGVERKGWMIGPPTAVALQKEVSQVESVLRMELWHSIPVEYSDKHFTQKEILLADSNFFTFFDFKLLMGDPRDVLSGPNKVVLTESAAKKYFNYSGLGDHSALGKQLLISNEKTPMVVSGIAADPPHNSHFHFNMLVSIESLPIYRQAEKGWWGIQTYTYMKLFDKTDIKVVEDHFPGFYDLLLDQAQGWEGFGKTWKEANASGNVVEYFTQPLTEIHLGSNLQYEFEQNGERNYLFMFGGIGIIIIVLACINFINLATARATARAKEVGIRKTIGAFKIKLVQQFLIESFFYAIVSIVLALGIVSMTLTPFNVLAEKFLTMNLLFSPFYMLLLSGFCVLITLAAGTYPAFYLSSFRAAEVLKGRLMLKAGDFSLRNNLVVIQFVISCSMIMATLVVFQQIQFLKTKDPGFEKGNIIALTNALSLENNIQPFKDELLTQPAILNAGISNRVPPNIETISGLKRKGEASFHWIYQYSADADHLATMGYRFKEGRSFSRKSGSDQNTVIINEAAAQVLGISDLNQKHCLGFPPAWCSEVIGIVKDFNFESLRNKVAPLVIFNGGKQRIMTVRVSPGNISEKIELIRQTWKKYSQASFEYEFVDEGMADLYQYEERFGQVILVFTILAIIVACLGLFGLVTYMASLRTKEIGIRKVLGASVQQVVVLLSKDFLKLVLIAIFIAIPVSWYGTSEWLETFAYRIDFGFLVVGVAASAMITIALLTVIYQSAKAAIANPVDSLRSE
jgi:putative ABC transport system permease protein